MSWRDVLPIHPAAELFPRMSPDELKALGEDIHKKNGLLMPVTVWKAQKHFPPQLLDGRNRLDAMEAFGFTIDAENVGTDSDPAIRLWMEGPEDEDWRAPIEVIEVRRDHGIDPYVYVIGANIHRRHLTGEQRRELIAKLLKTTPEKSDRQIAETVKASPTTVGSVRAEMEAKGDVSKLDTRRDSKGRRQPSSKPSKAGKKSDHRVAKRPTVGEMLVNELIDEAAKTAERKPKPRDDIGADSRAEAERLRVRIKELQAQVRQRDIKITAREITIEGLRRDIADLQKTSGDMWISEFQTAIKKWEETVETQRGIIARLEDENAKLRAGLAAPPADDGLDIPGFLDRTKQGAAS